jgi:glutathione S-transferase
MQIDNEYASAIEEDRGNRMYKLYAVKAWGSLAPHCVLAELDIPHEVIWVTPEERRGAYRQINPLGYVPTLVLPDGRIMFESSAIVSHLTDTKPNDLAPRPGTPDHAVYLSWLTWLNAEIYATMNAAEFLENAENKTGDAASRTALAQAVRTKVDDLFGIVERRLGETGGFMLGRQLSAADLYLMMITLWAKPAALYARSPHIAKLMAAVKARPVTARVLAENGVA